MFFYKPVKIYFVSLLPSISGQQDQQHPGHQDLVSWGAGGSEPRALGTVMPPFVSRAAVRRSVTCRQVAVHFTSSGAGVSRAEGQKQSSGRTGAAGRCPPRFGETHLLKCLPRRPRSQPAPFPGPRVLTRPTERQEAPRVPVATAVPHLDRCHSSRDLVPRVAEPT